MRKKSGKIPFPIALKEKSRSKLSQEVKDLYSENCKQTTTTKELKKALEDEKNFHTHRVAKLILIGYIIKSNLKIQCNIQNSTTNLSSGK